MKFNKLLTISISFISVIFFSCSSSEEEEKVVKDIAEVSKIETFKLQRNSITTEVTLPAELTGFRQVDLFAKVNSYVKTLKVDIGSVVTEGQILVELEAPEISSQLSAANSRLHSQQAIYDASNSTYQRLLETSKVEGTISRNDLDVASGKRKSDFQQLQASKAAYKEIQVMRNYLVIRAPFTGKITGRNINTGAYIAQGATVPMLTIQEQRKLRLSIAVPENYTGYLKTGDSLQFTVSAIKGEIYRARISRMAGALDLRLRAERVELDVENTKGQLLPGMVAEVKLSIKSRKATYAVPKFAVMTTSEGVYVIRVIDNKTQRVKVEQGLNSGEQVEIFSDKLNLNDVLIAKAGEEIREGSIVNQK